MVDITVIIPCFNQAHYLRFALDSVLAQSFTRWEAIVVNDGSADATAAVVQAYSDARIHTIYQENQGLSAARNRGISAAKGRYLAFLDADDEWESDFLSTCQQWLESDSNLAGVYTRCRYIDPDGAFLPGIGGLEQEPDTFRSRLLKGGFFPVHAALIRASVLGKSGYFDIELTSVEDWDLWLRISEQQGMRGIAQPLAKYRVYPGSMSTNTERMHANRMAVLAKNFGSLTADASDWSNEKRMVYAFAFRTTAMGFLGQGENEQGWHWMVKAFILWPGLMERVDTFYELACKDQQRGYRGQARLLDIDANGNELLARFNEFWANAPAELLVHRKIGLGNAHFALGMLYDQAGNWSKARMHLLAAIRANRRLIRDSSVQWRIAKVSFLNPRMAAMVRDQWERRNAWRSVT